MAEDAFKPVGKLKSYDSDAGGAAERNVPVFGIVKNNIDPIRSGRIQVYVSGFGGNEPDNKDNWITVNYMTPFYGSTIPDGGNTGLGSYISNPSSYGMWYPAPDLNSTVICIFINGDVNFGFWIGCVPKPEALTMVPAIGASENVSMNEGEAKGYGGATRLPVTNINTNNEKSSNNPTFLTLAKPVHSYQASIMTQQGVIRDPIRGPISSSAQRETPSRVGWGVSTPGRPIYSGGLTDEALAEKLANEPNPNDSELRVTARRGGHSIVMDDGDLLGQDQLIRIRTALGHQILMSDNGQTLMILHSNGQSYVELGKEGTVDVYSTNSINLRTQGDLNLHADNNINIHAQKELNIQAENIKVNSEKEFTLRSGTNSKFYAVNNYTVKSDAAMSFESAADSSFVSKSVTYVNGEKINLNTGASSTIPEDVKPIPIIAHTDTLHDAEKGFAAAPAKLLSITTRAPAHAPWANAGQGVDVKVSLSASDNLPPPPTGPVGSTNALASTIPSATQNPGVSVSTSAKMPDVGAVSKTLDKNTTSSLLGAAATIASAPGNPLAAATKTGFAIANVGGVKSLGVGSFAQTASQMVSGGVLKSGADKLVGTLLNSNIINPTPTGLPTDITKVLPSNLFTGKSGASSAASFISNQFAQGLSQVANLQKAQTALTSAGVISGKESVGQLSGLVLSGAQAGIASTVNAVKTAANLAAGGVTSLPTNQVTDAFKAIASGGGAAAIAQNITGGLGGVSKALGSLSQLKGGNLSLGNLLDSTKGVAGSAFAAITKQFKPLVPGIPQNLKEITKARLKDVESLAEGTIPTPAGIASTASSLASGLTNLPGGAKVVQGVINKANNAVAGAMNQIPGAAGIKQLASQAFNAKVTVPGGLPLPPIPGQLGGLLNKAATGLSGGAAAQLNSAIAAFSSGGNMPIKLPTVGFNTTKKDEILSQINNVLGSPKIPPPNFTGEISSAAKQSQDKFEQNRDTLYQKLRELKKFQSEQLEPAKKLFYKRESELPAGDPLIEEARQDWFAKVDENRRLTDELVKLQQG